MRRLVVVLACLSGAACSATSSDQGASTGESADELRALSSDEVVGSLSYGETSEGIEYSEKPTYRALRFAGSAGDEIEIDVHADGADARAWLLGPSYRTLRSNDNANASTRDSKIVHKLGSSGTHYIAFREKNFEETTFTVSLKKKNAQPPPPPPPPPPTRAIPEDISWCSGAEITQQELLSHYEPASTTAVLSNVVMDARQRECQDTTGCRPWTLSSSVPFYKISWGSGYSFSSPTSISVPQNGAARLSVGKPEIDLTIDGVPGFHANLNLPRAQAAGYQMWLNSDPVQVGGWSSGSGSYLWFSHRNVTSSCLYASSNGRVYHSPGPGTYTEYEVVFYARYASR